MNSVKIERILKAGIGVLLVLLVVVLYQAIHETIVEAGDHAPDFRIATDTGPIVSRGNFGGKILVLNFWATWCPPCVQEMPSLNSFARAMAPNGVVVLGVSVDKEEKAYKTFLNRAKVGFLTARDAGKNINVDYGTFKYPETYVIDAKGKVLQKFIGPENWDDPRMLQYFKSLL